MSDILASVNEYLSYEDCNNHPPHLSLLQRRLEEAIFTIAQLKKDNLHILLRHDGCISLLKAVAQEQIQRQNEINNLRPFLTTATMNFQHEHERHQEARKNLEHERKMKSSLVDVVNHLLLSTSTEMGSNTSENFNIEYFLEEQWDLKQRMKQMEKASQAKDARIESLQTRCEELEEDNNNINGA